MPVIKHALCGICHRLKKCSFNESVITGKGNIIEAQNLVRKNLKGRTLLPSEMPFLILAN